MIKHIYAWRQNSGAVVYEERYGNERFVRYASINGISDILGILPDWRMLATEVKKVGKKPSKEQRVFLKAIRKNCGVAIVAHSLDEVIEGLSRAASPSPRRHVVRYS